MASRSPTATKRSALFGLNMAFAAAKSAPPSARLSTRPVSPTPGFPTARKTPPLTAELRVNASPPRSMRFLKNPFCRSSTSTRSSPSSSALGARVTLSARMSSISATPSRAKNSCASILATIIPPRRFLTKSPACSCICPRFYCT